MSTRAASSQYDDGVRVKASARNQLAAAVEPGPAGQVQWRRRNHVHAIDRAQRNGVHEVLWVCEGHRATCSCGLVLSYNTWSRARR